jgi:hypothetical protein
MPRGPTPPIRLRGPHQRPWRAWPSFERQVDPYGVLADDVRLVMAVHARKACMLQLAGRSATARRRNGTPTAGEGRGAPTEDCQTVGLSGGWLSVRGPADGAIHASLSLVVGRFSGRVVACCLKGNGFGARAGGTKIGSSCVRSAIAGAVSW